MSDIDNLIERLGLQRLEGLDYRGVIGAGGQGLVCKYQRDDDTVLAVKMLIGERDTSVLLRFQQEAKALMKCQKLGNTIIAAHSEARKAPDLPVWYFVMDLAKGEPLSDRLKTDSPPWNWRTALWMVYRIAWALSPAHCVGLVHRDLHPGNIYIDDSQLLFSPNPREEHPGVWILDLGAHANLWDTFFPPEESAHTFRPVGSVRFASPEALNDPSSVKQTSDMWALGVLLYLILSGKFPFSAPTLRGLMDATSEGQIEYPEILGATAEEALFMNQLLHILLSPQPDGRMEIGGLTKVIVDALNHEAIPILHRDRSLWELYFNYRGDLWACTRCRGIVHPDGSRCPKCGATNEDWLHWTMVS